MYTLQSFDSFIEHEIKNGQRPTRGFIRLALTDFVNMSTDEFLAVTAMHKYVDFYKRVSGNPNSYKGFVEEISDGLIRIWDMTNRQKILFVCFCNDQKLVERVKVELANDELYLRELEKVMPYVVEILKSPDMFDEETVKTATEYAYQYVLCNKKVINYREYLDYIGYGREQ